MHVCTACRSPFVELACYERLCPSCELSVARQHLSTATPDQLELARFKVHSLEFRVSCSRPITA